MLSLPNDVLKLTFEHVFLDDASFFEERIAADCWYYGWYGVLEKPHKNITFVCKRFANVMTQLLIKGEDRASNYRKTVWKVLWSSGARSRFKLIHYESCSCCIKQALVSISSTSL